MKNINEFLSTDTGAVTIDWVALTAGVLLLGLTAVYAIFNDGASPAVLKINSTLTNMNIEVPSPTINPV